MWRKRIIWSLSFLFLVAAIYGGGRLYYKLTDGFLESNISSDLPYDPRWEMRPLSDSERTHVEQILSQPFHYLGKGCQSYVFLSEDGEYVIKFFKYQRFRTQPWLNAFTFIPAVDRYVDRKLKKKKSKLDGVFESWKLAFEELQPTTGVLFVHLNKTHEWSKPLIAYDKMGFEHRLDLNQLEFLIQTKAMMLCKYIRELMAQGNVAEAKILMNRIIDLILFEYQHGYADNDHALMQNTGVQNGYPIHIDVGQFVKSEEVKKPEVYKQDLFSKTYKFRKWLRKEYPELADYLETQLQAVIGEQYHTMKPHFKMHE